LALIAPGRSHINIEPLNRLLEGLLTGLTPHLQPKRAGWPVWGDSRVGQQSPDVRQPLKHVWVHLFSEVSMSILPQSALFVILQSWSLVLQLVSAYWYERQLSRYKSHWLLQLNQIADLSNLEEACAPFQADNGQGRPIRHTSRRLVRALLIKYLNDLSLRQTEELLDNHILFKWFVGYRLFEAPLDHSYLNRFEMWLFRNNPRLFFNEVIGLIDKLCPEDRLRIQLVDTFALHGRVAKTYLVELLRDVCGKILPLVADTDPDFHLSLLADLELITLFGHRRDKITAALKGAERGQRLQDVTRQALRLSRLLSQHLDQATHLTPEQQLGLRVLVAYLDKIISDETKVTANNPDDPDEVTITERKHGHKGQYRIVSASDFETTYRKHDNNKEAIAGFNATTLSTKTFIRETQVDTGAQQDNIALPEVLQAQHHYHRFYPDFVAGDMKYGYGKTRYQVSQVTDGQTQVIALIPDYDQRSDLYNPRNFTLSDDGLALTCPADKTTSARYLTPDKGGVDFRFSVKCCRGCDHWVQCRGPDSKKSVPRNVFISFYRGQLQAAQLFNETDIAKQGLKERMNVERQIYSLTNIYGARRAHSYGLKRTDYQLKMQATAHNLRQLVREMVKKGPSQGGVCSNVV
jgi:hypothetical protein